MTSDGDYRCPTCGGLVTAGHTVTYTDDTAEPVVIIQGVPAQVCQQCGERFYDSDMAVRLSQQVDAIRAGKMTRVVALMATLDTV